MRPFLWHNYHSKNQNDKIELDLRYTSYINISEFFLKKKDENTIIYNDLDGRRQTDIKKAKDNNLKVVENKDIDLFITFYNKLLSLQKIEVSKLKLDRMKNLIENLLNENLCRSYCTLNSDDIVTYATIFTLDNNRGCYLFGAGDRSLMERYDGTYCIWIAMKKLSEEGVSQIDMEGVNSPERGKFKLGFGGILKPYYHISKNKKNIKK